MLHIISQSLFKSRAVGVGIRSLTCEDAVLLIGDGVYSASHPDIAGLENVYAIDEDRVTRGLKERDAVRYIDYAAMVVLTEMHSPIVTWS